MKVITTVLILFFLQSSYAEKYTCFHNTGTKFCTTRKIFVDNNIMQEINKRSSPIYQTGELYLMWNRKIRNVFNYLKSNNMNIVNIGDGSLRDISIGVEIYETNGDIKYNIIQEKNAHRLKKGVEKVIGTSFFDLLHNLIKGTVLANHFVKIYIDGKRNFFSLKDGLKTHVDVYGNLFLDKQTKNLSNKEIELIMLHEAFHLFPINLTNNIIIEKYVYLNNLKLNNKKEVFELSKDSTLSLSYDSIFPEKNYNSQRVNEQTQDVLVINFLFRNKYNCNDYINVLNKFKIDPARKKFTIEYCRYVRDKKNRFDPYKFEINVIRFALKIQTEINITSKNYVSYESVLILFNKLIKNEHSLNRRMALKYLLSMYQSNKQLIIKRKFYNDIKIN